MIYAGISASARTANDGDYLATIMIVYRFSHRPGLTCRRRLDEEAMIYIDTTKPLDVPQTIAHCPECQGCLFLDIDKYTEDGEITEAGFYVFCENEEAEPDLHHERWIRDWRPVEAAIYGWLLDNVRVADATETDLQAWNEAVRDWAR